MERLPCPCTCRPWMQTYPWKNCTCLKMLRQFTFCRPIYGLIFLFKWQKEQDTRPVMSDDEHAGRLFFARQVVTNACATQALLSILLNRQDLTLGPELNSLKEFTADFDPEMRGKASISHGTNLRLLCIHDVGNAVNGCPLVNRLHTYWHSY